MISGLAFLVVASAGFLTFGLSSSGFILNNYSPLDPLITSSRVALALSIALTYPLPFFGLRDGVLDVLQVPQEDRTDIFTRLLSVGLLLGVTIGAYFVKDLALVLSVGGGTFSTAISSVFPTLMFRAAVKQLDPSNDLVKNEHSSNDLNLALVLMTLSVLIGVSGVCIAIMRAVN
jgi:amino acid permease